MDARHAHPRVVLGLSDAGAHCGAICDGGMPTWLLSHGVRDRTRGPRWSIERAVQGLTADPAALYGVRDRGALRVGLCADLNLIDLDRLDVTPPVVACDLPSGACSSRRHCNPKWGALACGRRSTSRSANRVTRIGSARDQLRYFGSGRRSATRSQPLVAP